MAKIFDIQDWLKNNPNRNNFDLTHKVHGSYRFGMWYPFLCKPVVPTDSFHIETAVSTRFMPMPFPTQSNMRLVFHYHFVRMKNIWPNFENWLMGLEEHTPPYLNLPHTFYKDGSLADYLGVQTSSHVAETRPARELVLNVDSHQGSFYQHEITSLSPDFCFLQNWVPATNNGLPCKRVQMYGTWSTISGFGTLSPTQSVYYRAVSDSPFIGDALPLRLEVTDFALESNANWPTPPDDVVYVGLEDSVTHETYVMPYNMVSVEHDILKLQNVGGFADEFYYLNNSYLKDYFEPKLIILFPCSSAATPFSGGVSVPAPYSGKNVLYDAHLGAQTFEIGSSSVNDCPYFCSDTAQGDTNVVKVSALPFRAYESICRAYYQNTQGVQPFVVNGVTKYNQWNTTTDDGADSTNYQLFKRNWELDSYTSCLLTPQQLPVFVGLTSVSSLGNMRLETPDGQEASVRLMDGDNPNSVEYTNLQAETPEARRYALNVASLGFTIPEFREANSLQRWLEMNIRKGYRYKDFIEGHFGKAPKYSELDMPEFLGGFTQRVSVNDISNTNGGTDPADISGTLGAIAGQARAIGGSKHGVNHYFDDYGFVVGVFCIVPDTAYDCLLPKHFNLKSPLDFFFPEFAQTSFQEITYEELTPAQRKRDRQTLASTFGYQRPNHDLVWYPDTVHGRFRDASGIGNSVICRRFSTAPQLSSDFLSIDPQSTDTIFSYTLGDEDICLGEIVIGISAKRPIPRLFNPSIQ